MRAFRKIVRQTPLDLRKKWIYYRQYHLKRRRSKWRNALSLCFCADAFFGIAVCQNFEHLSSEYAQAAVRNNTRTITVGSARGTFYDCNGLPLVNSEKRYVALLKPTPEALSAIEPYVDAEELSGIREKMSKGYPVSVHVDTDAIDCSDITVVEAKVRYTQRQPAVHLIGHLDGAGEKGETGLEKSLTNGSKCLKAICA